MRFDYNINFVLKYLRSLMAKGRGPAELPSLIGHRKAKVR